MNESINDFFESARANVLDVPFFFIQGGGVQMPILAQPLVELRVL